MNWHYLITSSQFSMEDSQVRCYCSMWLEKVGDVEVWCKKRNKWGAYGVCAHCFLHRKTVAGPGGGKGSTVEYIPNKNILMM